MLELNRLLSYNELLQKFHNKSRSRRAEVDKEIWLDDTCVVEISPQQLIDHLSVQIVSQDDNPTIHQGDSFRITEVIYMPFRSKKPAIRDIDSRHLLPSEIQRPHNPPITDLPKLKIFLDIYLDKYGPYRNVYNAWLLVTCLSRCVGIFATSNYWGLYHLEYNLMTTSVQLLTS